MSAAFKGQVSAWVSAVREAAAEAAVGMAKEAFEKILRNSPQYSGDFVAGWGVGYGSIVSNFKEGQVPGNLDTDGPFSRGDQPGMDIARQAAKWQKLKLGTSIYISNDAKHDEPYAWKIEKGEINFRTPNMGASKLVEHAVKSLGRNYAKINKPELAILRRVGA